MTEYNEAEMLAQYAAIDRTIAVLNERKEEIKSAVEIFVTETGEPIAAHGLIARMKPGRKTYDHELAVCNAQESGSVSDDEIRKLIGDHTIQPKPRTKWAKVTKDAGIDVSGYCTQKPDTFVIEPI